MLLCLGLSFRQAALDLRARFSLDPEEIEAFAHESLRLQGPDGQNYILGQVWLSTCNRSEVYFHLVPGLSTENFATIESDLESRLLEACSVSVHEAASLLVHRRGPEVVRHLMRISTGLESMVLGESEILGQVKRALETAREYRCIDPILDRLFVRSLRTGRQVRRNTGIGKRAVSIPTVALEQARQHWQRVETSGAAGRPSLVVLGAGKMARITMQQLDRLGAQSVQMINRDQERARELLQSLEVKHVSAAQASVHDYTSLSDVLVDADILIASTAASEHVVDATCVADAMAKRPERELLMVDIALPRDIDPAVRDIPGVHLIDLDDLQAGIEAGLAQRRASMPEALAQIETNAQAFDTWLSERELVPTLKQMQGWAERIRNKELDRAMRSLKGLNPRERAAVESLSSGIIGKLLHQAIRQLKIENDLERRELKAALLNDMFSEPVDSASGQLSKA